ncbi:nucleotidyltransferase family protein [Pygmaiobacter massiliensis]|uniref:nucleotidyltransferase family protein n=1 Tax=Pygmaiobacter massiliensis TaxID=1917873 RepID=UPI000C7A0E2E|nr:sugar phosphate nucleotidyltransferase [Pygmaiobacter massiliensis]
MQKPVLAVMAAGMGSRYGGLKQIDPVGPSGEVIIDYSLFDARRAGFEKVVFIIKHEIEDDFKAVIGERISKVMQVEYAFQQLDILPEGYTVPEGREKPWGTAHAVLAAKSVIDGPFAVINADDYYGPEAFQKIYDYLATHQDDEKYEYAMVGYHLRNTLTEHGHVARGVCEVGEDGFLQRVTEHVKIVKDGNDAKFTEDEGKTWESLPGETTVSMNLWGFTPSFLKETEARFNTFLDRTLTANPMKGEYFLPSVVSALIDEDKARVQVLTSKDKWYGVTYKEDKPVVVAALRSFIDAGVYPEKLWEE